MFINLIILLKCFLNNNNKKVLQQKIRLRENVTNLVNKNLDYYNFKDSKQLADDFLNNFIRTFIIRCGSSIKILVDKTI